MEKNIAKNEKRRQRHQRIRSKIKGSSICPRFSVFRSNRALYLQLIDDEKERTLVGFSDLKLKGKNKTEKAFLAGQKMAEEAKKLKIEQTVFDRGGYKFQGRIKAVADGAKEKGLKI